MKRDNKGWLWSGLAALYGCFTIAVSAAEATEINAGPELYRSCAACHGANAEGNQALGAPALAGQDPVYLQRQLTHFRLGIRGDDPRDPFGRQMLGAAKTLSGEADVDAVVAHIASLPVSESAPEIPHDRRNGEVQYNAGCGACHGPGGKGNPALNAPRLAGLDAAYLRRQFGYFAEGVRGSHPDDRLGRQMQMMTSMLASEDDVTDVIGYLLAQ